MLNFKEIKTALTAHFKQLAEENDYLYTVDLDKDQLWETYLNAIPPQHNKIYKVRREHDCSSCRHFIKSIGNVVAIKDGKVISIWDFETGNKDWDVVVKALSEFVKAHPITAFYLSKFNRIGNDYDMDQDENGEPIRWDHFFLSLPDKFVFGNRFRRSSTIDTELSVLRDNKEVFKRSLEELSLDSVESVLELINQGSLYKGDEYKKNLEEFRRLKKEYDNLEDDNRKDLFTWENSPKIHDSVAKIRNTAIGTLLIDISGGEDLDVAVRKYEKVVAPANYKRSKPIFTQKMLDDAQKTITELGYLDSLRRRYANVDDITVNNVLFSNRDVSKRLNGNSADDLFGALAKDTKKSAKKFSKVEEIQIEDFIKNVLPTASEVEAYVENKHSANLVSLIAPVNKNSKPMFKWADNNFSWAYTGNVTDSVLKQNVKNAGGKVDGVLRFSIQWNDLGKWNLNDEDAHCIEPNNFEIYYGRKISSKTGGNLDIDIIHPNKDVPAVENITYPDKDRMIPGVYKFFVHTFAGRGGRGGFRAEIECNGEIHSYNYTMDTRDGQNIFVAEVTLDKNGNFTVKDLLPSNLSNKEIWGIHTNEFVPVRLICYSPNYWNGSGVGNKHYFFMLNGCVNPELPNGFYNEFLNNELYQKYRKVMEAIASKAHVEDCEDQLSGLGFSSTLRNDLVVKVKGNTERILKIKF